MLLRLRLPAVYYLNELADSARQAIAVGEPLAAGLRTGAGPGPAPVPGSRRTTSLPPAGQWADRTESCPARRV